VVEKSLRTTDLKDLMIGLFTKTRWQAWFGQICWRVYLC